MTVTKTDIEGLFVIEPTLIADERGYFFESYNWMRLKDEIGIETRFIQDNQARSMKNVLRGLHYQNEPSPQAKLVRAIIGSIWDVAVDIRKASTTYGHWFGIELSAENRKQLYIPEGFAHGYAVLSDAAEVFYKCNNFYDKSAEGGIYYGDEQLMIDWKIDLKIAIVSPKDMVQPRLKDASIDF